MAAKKKRMVWRISDIVGAAEPGNGSFVREWCARFDGDVSRILDLLNVTLPRICGVRERRWVAMSTDERAAALVATAKRLRVPMVTA